METLFVECISEVRKEIMRRRLRNDLYTKKKFYNHENPVQSKAKDFEDSLLRLAKLAKNRIKLDEFT